MNCCEIKCSFTILYKNEIYYLIKYAVAQMQWQIQQLIIGIQEHALYMYTTCSVQIHIPSLYSFFFYLSVLMQQWIYLVGN